MKINFRVFFLAILITLSYTVYCQPPPPPPDPGGIGTDPYPPGWVGKSPVGDGYWILIAMGIVYSAVKFYQFRRLTKKKSLREII